MRILCLFLVGFSLEAFAGPITSGGGNAIVCRGENGKILSAELLDLYEARVGHGLTPSASSGDAKTDFVESRIRMFQRYLDNPMSDDMRSFQSNVANDQFQDFMRPLVFTAPGEHLPLLTDQGDMLSPPAGCALEQLAIFGFQHPDSQDWDVFRVDREIYDALDSNNRAALAFHELNYRNAKWTGEPTSELTRSYVGYEFTSSPLPKVYQDIPKRQTPSGYVYGMYVDYECHGGNGGSNIDDYSIGFFILPVPNGKGKRVQLTNLGARLMPTQTYIDLPEVNWSLSSRKPDDPPPVVIEPGMDIQRRVPLQSVQQVGLELEVIYKTGQPVKFNVIHKSKTLANTTVGSCLARGGG